jgi:two-component system, cell cycle response regulator DivK
MKILLIEDSRFLRGLLERALTRAGYQVLAAADGEEGLQQARLEIPSLVLLDMMLPGLDGPGVLKALKSDAATAAIPVVVLTGLSQRNETKLKQDGAAAYVEKTALELDKNPGVLLKIVARTLETASGGHSPGIEGQANSRNALSKA